MEDRLAAIPPVRAGIDSSSLLYIFFEFTETAIRLPASFLVIDSLLLEKIMARTIVIAFENSLQAAPFFICFFPSFDNLFWQIDFKTEAFQEKVNRIIFVFADPDFQFPSGINS